ncbi:LPS biosynthesis protein [Slackia heliotrinireducens]|uniref:LICD family protein n=1 Tax=Slackia heliotrinireducens (strain ATCC 29202 / DSM 20476 / NCTC 11029 / RHS 1) TaxID=471855 RepID=C7N5S9_SLAHD|nr:LICD family protein [Slackia heliotrinireducens]ACV22264.1 LICD family protein [Slackia heliotrinireducens DSM 20476]VEH00429.1 LPS biosynthesis protein [Slackia heliotrinireducens]
MLFELKRCSYLRIKKIVNRYSVLKKMNTIRRRIRGSKGRKAVEQNGLKTASAVVSIMENSGFEPVLSFGTLLGAVREHDLIHGDNDIDLGIIVDYNDDETWRKVRSVLEEGGYQLLRQYSYSGSITEQAYGADGFSFDVWGFLREPDGRHLRSFYHCRIDEGVYHSDRDRSIKYIDMPVFENRRYTKVGEYQLPVPINAEQMVAAVYGDDWQTPNPNFVAGTGFTLVEGVVETYQEFMSGH